MKFIYQEMSFPHRLDPLLWKYNTASLSLLDWVRQSLGHRRPHLSRHHQVQALIFGSASRSSSAKFLLYANSALARLDVNFRQPEWRGLWYLIICEGYVV